MGGSKFSSVKLDSGKTYFSSTYKTVLGNNYYGRGTISNSGKVSISYFKGEFSLLDIASFN
jgi:hypothetical protein